MADEPTMKEKLDTLKNDAKVRSTYFSQAVADASSAGGRFSQGSVAAIGSAAVTAALSAPCSGVIY